MTDNRNILDGALRQLNTRLRNHRPLNVDLVTDITEDNSNGEIVRGIEARLAQAGLLPFVAPRNLHTGAFQTHNAAMQVAKSLCPLPSIDLPDTVTLVNVAEINDASGGVRKDHVFVGVGGLKRDRLILGFATAGSPILSLVQHQIGALFRVDVGDRFSHMHFRSRDGLPEILAGLIAGDRWPCEQLHTILHGSDDVYSIGRYKPGLAAWWDHIGGYPCNLKTGYQENDPTLRGRFGERFTVGLLIDDKPLTLTVRYVKSVQDADHGEVVLSNGSSGYDTMAGPVHFVDLFCKGQPLPKKLGIDPFGVRGAMTIERVNAS